MEENNTQVLEDTTLTGTEAVDDDTAANDGATNTSGDNVDDSAAADGNDGASDGDDNAAADGTEPMLTIRYNHSDKALSMAEAKELAQKGLKFDSMTDMLNDISYLAAIQGKTPAELIKGYIEAGENIRRQELIEKYGEDEVVEVLMEKYRNENQKKFTAAKETLKQKEEAAEQDLNQRIADDFLKMKADFPELTDYAALPNEVKRQAANGTPLKYAYLDYKYAQEKAAANAKAQAEAAAKKSTGSMATDDGVDSAENALLKGLWG